MGQREYVPLLAAMLADLTKIGICGTYETDQILTCGLYTVNYVKIQTSMNPFHGLGREMHWYTSGPNNQLRRVISLLVVMLDFFWKSTNMSRLIELSLILLQVWNRIWQIDSIVCTPFKKKIMYIFFLRLKIMYILQNNCHVATLWYKHAFPNVVTHLEMAIVQQIIKNITL